jgi:hypothetical protein
MASSLTDSGSIAQSGLPVAGGSSIQLLLRLEGLGVAAVTAIMFARTGVSWWLFLALWLVPDLSMLGYLDRIGNLHDDSKSVQGTVFLRKTALESINFPYTNSRSGVAGSCRGARIYNAMHTYVGPVALGVCAYVLRANVVALAIALIWANHIGVDRLLGYGLKYGDGFGFTHLGRVGKARS